MAKANVLLRSIAVCLFDGAVTVRWLSNRAAARYSCGRESVPPGQSQCRVLAAQDDSLTP